jgi:IS30 family transposase
MDLSHLSQDDLDAVARELNAVARELNARPRKTLDYLTPADILAQTVALTG